LDEDLIKIENVYNRPEFIKNSGSKAEFHKIVDGDENIPKTCLKTEDAIKEIGFPMIAKPTEGHSGLGIQVIKNQKEFDAVDHSKLDVYSQYIDKKSEHRFFTFKGKPFFWQERQPTNDKAKTGDGDGKERMMFDYIKKDVSKTPEKFNELIAKFGKIFKDLPFICFDIMEDQDGKLYVIESNSMPGVPFDSTVDIYRVLFEDFYGRPVDSDTDAKLQELADYMIKRSAELDGGNRFRVEK
jgi:glutathione synthase/RimK-type ligase-like ATP-grasp enzyme